MAARVAPALQPANFVCSHCGGADAPYACGRCRSVRFCSLSCQRAAWRQGHKVECSAAAALVAADAAPSRSSRAGQVSNINATGPLQLRPVSNSTSLGASGPEVPWLVLPGIATESERLHLLKFAQAQMASGELRPNPAGPKRFFQKLDETGVFDPLIEELTVRLEVAVRGVAGCPRDRTLGRVCSWIEPGGYIHEHTDRYRPGAGLEGCGHLRANIVVQMQPSSRPLIAGSPVEVSELDAWVFLASHQMHATAVVQGSKPRIVFGFGWTVPGDFSLAAA